MLPALAFVLAAALQADALAGRFQNPPDEAAATMYWTWFGPAVTREGIDRDLANMHQAHIGGTVLLPVYALSEDDARRGIRNLPFLLPEFLDMLSYTAGKSREMKMTFDVTLGTGWPYGGPWITPDLAARMLRARNAGAPAIPGEQVVTRFGDQVIVSVPTRMTVKRPALGGEGLVLDPYNPRALARHLDVAGEKLWQAVKGAGIRSFWCDSLEIFQANWTPDFLNSFARLRGYDLKPLLPLLFGDETAEARQVRHDFWQTLSQLGEESFIHPLQQWCHRKGVALQMESYGQPPVALGSFRFVDLPVGEHYEWRMFNASRWASSGGHLHGKNVIGAEAWTWIGLPNRFADSLEQIKLASDMHFVSGINSLMGLTYAYTPPSAGKPGWAPYWGPVVNHNQTWWPYFPLLSRYLQRVSFTLRQGRPVADIALYLPADDAFAGTPASSSLNLYFAVRDLMHGKAAPEFGLENAKRGETPVISTLIRSGYSFDGIDSSTLPHARIENSRLRMGLGDYAAVVLPGLAGMPLADLEKLAAFVRSGGVVIATRRLPGIAYGWKDEAASTAKLKDLVREMFLKGRYGKGRAIFVKGEREGLRPALLASVEPDAPFEDPDVAFVHRKLDDQDLYFVANLGAQPKTLAPRFRARGAAQIWDPMTGQIAAISNGGLRLDPYGSVIVRIGKGAGPKPSQPAPQLHSVNVEGPWTLRAPGLDASRLEKLLSWLDIPGMKHFSGTAAYDAGFDLQRLAPGARVALDLGDVREIADVELNGKSAGVAWKRPYRLEVTSLLQPGRNSLRVRVTNLWINAILGTAPPDYSRLRAKFGNLFPDPSEWKTSSPLPSGILGPVRLEVGTLR